MSGLAQILLEEKFAVSGCDVVRSSVTERLEKLGAKISFSHDAAHLEGSDCLVYSSAISANHPELRQAIATGKTVLHRSHMLSFLSEGKKGIAVTGCHGKTTTSAMLAAILAEAGWDPTAVIGAEVQEFDGNARFGRGEHFVYEADESDGSFVRFSPDVFVVTNLDNDHLDYYQSFPKLLQLFKDYLEQRRGKQRVFISGEDPVLREWKKEFPGQSCLTFGFEAWNDFSARDLALEGWRTQFTLFRGDEKLGRFTLALPGRHNVANAVAASAVALELGVPMPALQKTLAAFRGAQRRFQIKGEARDILVVDDYAHHPTEITAALEAARALCRRKVICVFQPHRYTRTRDLGPLFPKSLSAADEVFLTDVYAANETQIDGVDGALLYAESRKAGYNNFHYMKDCTEIARHILPELKQGDLVMTVGAGDVYKVGEELIERLKNG